MRKMRLPILIALGVFVIGLIFGSIFDLQISQALGNPSNGFALTVAAIGPTIGFLGLTVIGGGFLGLGLQKERPTFQKVIFIIVCAAAYLGSIYYAGVEYFEENGFNKPNLIWLGFLIAALVLPGGVFLGYRIFKEVRTPYAWLILAIGALVVGLSLLSGVMVLKGIFHRPRFRAVTSYESIEFHQWWQRCKNYKDLMELNGITSEEFKSFPSGHTGEAAILMIAATFIPVASEKVRKYQVPCFYIAFAFTLFVAFSRILAAAHFLSDVSMAGILACLLSFIANEVIIRMKWTKGYDAPAKEANAE